MKSNNPSRTRKSSNSGEAASGEVALVAAIIAAATFIVFIPALENDFVNWDDYETLVNNSRYRGLAWPQLSWMFTTFHMGHFQPLSWLSFALDHSLWGMNPFGYHLTNLVIHS